MAGKATIQEEEHLLTPASQSSGEQVGFCLALRLSVGGAIGEVRTPPVAGGKQRRALPAHDAGGQPVEARHRDRRTRWLASAKAWTGTAQAAGFGRAHPTQALSVERLGFLQHTAIQG